MTDAKPTNAYELLLRVADHIEEEPRRYYQDVIALVGAEIVDGLGEGFQAPACGTVCCRAGWIVALHDGPGALTALRDRVDFFDVWDRAVQIINDPNGDHGDSIFMSGLVDGVVGTPQYAKAGADGLREFADTYRDELTARLLADVPPLEVEP